MKKEVSNKPTNKPVTPEPISQAAGKAPVLDWISYNNKAYGNDPKPITAAEQKVADAVENPKFFQNKLKNVQEPPKPRYIYNIGKQELEDVNAGVNALERLRGKSAEEIVGEIYDVVPEPERFNDKILKQGKYEPKKKSKRLTATQSWNIIKQSMSDDEREEHYRKHPEDRPIKIAEYSALKSIKKAIPITTIKLVIKVM